MKEKTNLCFIFKGLYYLYLDYSVEVPFLFFKLHNIPLLSDVSQLVFMSLTFPFWLLWKYLGTLYSP